MIDAERLERVSSKIFAMSPPLAGLKPSHTTVCLVESLGDPLLEAVNGGWEPQTSPTLSQVDDSFTAELDEELGVIDRVCDVLLADKAFLIRDPASQYVSRLLGVLKSCRLAGFTVKHLESVWFHAVAARTELMDRVDSYKHWSALAGAIWPHGSVSVPARFVTASPEEEQPRVVDLRKVRIARHLRSVIIDR